MLQAIVRISRQVRPPAGIPASDTVYDSRGHRDPETPTLSVSIELIAPESMLSIQLPQVALTPVLETQHQEFSGGA
jgi:hypothetical protein